MFNLRHTVKNTAKRTVTFGVICVLLVGGGSVAAQANKEQLKDPTTPLGYRAAAGRQGNGFVVNSILHGSERKQAVINGKTVRENDFVGGALVRQITANSVVLVLDGKTQILKLRQQLIKTQSN